MRLLKLIVFLLLGLFPFGEVVHAYSLDGYTFSEWGDTADRQRANTKDEDPTKLLNEGFRYRDLETGAFLTRDKIDHLTQN